MAKFYFYKKTVAEYIFFQFNYCLKGNTTVGNRKSGGFIMKKFCSIALVLVLTVTMLAGCRGNTQGLSALAEGMAAEELIARLEGTQCRGGTSCPDQLAKAVKEALAK